MGTTVSPFFSVNPEVNGTVQSESWETGSMASFTEEVNINEDGFDAQLGTSPNILLDFHTLGLVFGIVRLACISNLMGETTP